MSIRRVVGSSVAAMFAAQLLIEEDGKAVWHLPDGRLKSHFTSLNIDDHYFDLGMVLLEPQAREEIVDIRNASEPKGRAGLLKLADAFAWLTTHGLKMIEIPVLDLTDSGYVDDIIISDDLSALGYLPEEVKIRIVNELSSIIKSVEDGSIRHPRDKFSAAEFSQSPLGEYLIHSVGIEVASRFFLPWLNKLGNATLNIPAQLHRSVWAPLYYPETLLEFLELGKSPLQRATFSVPDGSSLNGFVTGFFDRLANNPKLSICVCRQNGCDLETIIHESEGKAYAFPAGDELTIADKKNNVGGKSRPSNTHDFATLEFPILTYTCDSPLPDLVVFDLREHSPILRFTSRDLHQDGGMSSISVELNSNFESESDTFNEGDVMNWIPNEITQAHITLQDSRRAKIRIPQCSIGNGSREIPEVAIDPIIELYEFYATVGRDFSSFNDQLTMALFAVKGN